VSRYRFIAAEKVTAQAVLPACALLGVSRSAYYQWRSQPPSHGRRQDVELGERIAPIHRESRETYGYRACKASCNETVPSSSIAHGGASNPYRTASEVLRIGTAPTLCPAR